MVYLKFDNTVVVVKQCKCCEGKGFKPYPNWKIFQFSASDAYPCGGTIKWNTGYNVRCLACAGLGESVRFLSRGRSLTPVVHRKPRLLEGLFA